MPDPYRWLEDGDAPDTAGLGGGAATPAPGRCSTPVPAAPPWSSRFAELFAAGTAGAPSIRGGRLFSIDRWGDHEQAVLVVRDVHGDRVPAARTLVDPHALTGDPTAALDWYSPSLDGRLVAFGTSTGGDERSTLGVVDVATGERAGRLASPTPGRRRWRGCPTAAPSPTPATPTPRRWARRRPTTTAPSGGTSLGDDPGHDELVFGDLPDKTAWPSVELSRDGRWLVVEVSLGWTRVDVHLDRPHAPAPARR